MPVALVLASMSFVVHAATFGSRGLASDLSGLTHLYSAERPIATLAIFGHMLVGAVITVLAPIQLIGPLRRRYPHVHRWSGYLLVACAIPTAIGGIAYIAMHGTIGGPLMDYAFAGYGACVLIAAVQTVRHARARNLVRHREWAFRLFVLAIGSWIYRAHYEIWYGLTGGLWTAPGFSGPFDTFQLFAFYVPYLLALEVYFRRTRKGVHLPGAAVPRSIRTRSACEAKAVALESHHHSRL